jgi:hypothetical protein
VVVVRMMKWTAEIERVYGEAWWRLENIVRLCLVEF